jgi:hypothetical protein
MYVYMHTCVAAKLESQRTTGTKTPGEGGAAAAGRTKLLLYYCRTQETPDQEGHQRNRRVHGGSKRHRQDWKAQRGGRERHQEDRREQRKDQSGPQGQRDPTRITNIAVGNFPACPYLRHTPHARYLGDAGIFFYRGFPKNTRGPLYIIRTYVLYPLALKIVFPKNTGGILYVRIIRAVRCALVHGGSHMGNEYGRPLGSWQAALLCYYNNSPLIPFFRTI